MRFLLCDYWKVRDWTTKTVMLSSFDRFHLASLPPAINQMGGNVHVHPVLWCCFAFHCTCQNPNHHEDKISIHDSGGSQLVCSDGVKGQKTKKQCWMQIIKWQPYHPGAQDGCPLKLMATFPLHGTARYSTVHFWGVFHWVLYLVPDYFLVPLRSRFHRAVPLPKRWRL